MLFTDKQTSNRLILIRGGGDLATGVVQKLWRSGFKVLVLEIENPLCIRRNVSLSNAIYEKSWQVEDMTGVYTKSYQECHDLWQERKIPVMVDSKLNCLKKLTPLAVVDAVIAKRNIGTSKSMAPISIALGPGYKAPVDVDAVIETARGHDLGRLIVNGEALPNTGIPGSIGGESAKRVIKAPADGKVTHNAKIGDIVKKNDILMYIDEVAVLSPLNGILRGLIAEGSWVKKGLKIGDVDPRSFDLVNWESISDKARCLGGATLEAVFLLAEWKKIKLFL